MKYHTHKCNDPCTGIGNCTHLTTTLDVGLICKCIYMYNHHDLWIYICFSVRCKRTSFTCQRGDVECLTAPISLSYNFLSFPSNIKIPTDLFAMSGPLTSQKQFAWDLKVIDARPLKSGVMAVNRGYFDLKVENSAQAVVSLNYRIQGPQDVELELTMQITDLRSRYTGTAVSKIFLYVTGDSVV